METLEKTPEQEELLRQIVEMADTACSATLELLSLFEREDMVSVGQLLQDLRMVEKAIAQARESVSEFLEHAYTEEMLENIEDTLDDIERSIDAGNKERAAMKMEFQLFPFWRLLKEAFYFWGLIYPDKERMDRYYKEKFAENHRNFYVNEGEEPLYHLSIVVPAYNHLDVTKQCIEHLMKETDFQKLNAELILIDHGSTDGTLKYFESLGVFKTIHFKRNVRTAMFSILHQFCQGQYFVMLSNDVLVTPNWIELLLECVMSDPKIAEAVPSTPNISNIQMLHVPTNDPEKFIEWAAEYNRSDSRLWSDRARLMPNVACYNMNVVNKLGFSDPYYYTFDFEDDDFSLRSRRAGYRRVLCENIACYHYPSKTASTMRAQENTLEIGRELFKQKHGVDPWANDFCYNYNAVHFLTEDFEPAGELAILCIDDGFGDTALQVRNVYRKQNKNCRIYHIIVQKNHELDLKNQADGLVVTMRESLSEAIEKSFGNIQFSHIYISEGLEHYDDIENLFFAIGKRMQTNGRFLFSVENPFFSSNLLSFLRLKLPDNKNSVRYIQPETIESLTSCIFEKVHAITGTCDIGESKSELKAILGARFEQNESILSTKLYYFLCCALKEKN